MLSEYRDANHCCPSRGNRNRGTLVIRERIGSMTALDNTIIEDRVRDEFANAFEALERASTEEKPQATSRLNRAVRRLYDFVGYGKIPRAGRARTVDPDVAG